MKTFSWPAVTGTITLIMPDLFTSNDVKQLTRYLVILEVIKIIEEKGENNVTTQEMCGMLADRFKKLSSGEEK